MDQGSQQLHHEQGEEQQSHAALAWVLPAEAEAYGARKLLRTPRQDQAQTHIQGRAHTCSLASLSAQISSLSSRSSLFLSASTRA